MALVKLAFRGNLQAALDERGVSQQAFAYAAGISLASVARAVRGELVSAPTFGKIIRALGAIAPVAGNGRASGTSTGVESARAVAAPRRPSGAKP